MTEENRAGESLTFFDSMLDVHRKIYATNLLNITLAEHDKKMQLRKDIADVRKQELVEQGIHIDLKIWTCLQTVSSSSGIPLVP